MRTMSRMTLDELEELAFRGLLVLDQQYEAGGNTYKAIRVYVDGTQTHRLALMYVSTVAEKRN